ncbi:MAG: M10 family metallopeptidase [Xenococcaceae cyanobacterium MO_167.B27]|nr:M10 family metallopeptidase [Xenococcaceae cyanobacterium MO_167.B27]
MSSSSIDSSNKIFEQLNADQLLNTDLESDKSWDIKDIISSNSKLNKGFGWVGTSQEELQTSVASSSCDCPYCCGEIVPDFESVNTSNNFLDSNTPLLAAASSEVTSISYSGNNSIDSLIYPAKWTSNTITYSFFDGGSYYGSEDNVTPITETMKNYLRDILESLENIIDVDFVEVSDAGNNYGQIRYMFSDDPSTAYTKSPYKYPDSPKAGDIHFNPDKTEDFEAGPGAYRYETLIHETLHALSLKHPGNYNGSSTGNQSGEFLPYAEDNSNNTVMSYNRLRYTDDYSGLITPMAYDIRALQYIYGAASYNEGNTIYNFSDIDGYTVEDEFFGNKNFDAKQTLWDSGGTDTFNFSQLDFDSSGYRFDLREGGVITSQNAYQSTSYEARGDESGQNYSATSTGTWIAYNMTIENVINSSSDDYIIANEGTNIFGGYSLSNSTGEDVIVASDNEDTLDLSGYKVSDFTIVATGDDLIFDFAQNGSITIKDYYKADVSDRIQIITFDSDSTLPIPMIINEALVWENQNLSDESAVAPGSQFNLGNGVAVTVDWSIITDGGSFVPYGGEDFVSYDSDKLGNHTGYLSLGFNNSKNDPDDRIKLSLNFNQAVTSLSFQLLDVDQSDSKSFDDGVEIYADGVNIKNLSGVEIVTGDNVFADNETYMNGFEGRGSANSSSESGDISISFGSIEVSELEIQYFSTDDAISDPGSQKIGISDLDFQIKST